MHMSSICLFLFTVAGRYFHGLMALRQACMAATLPPDSAASCSLLGPWQLSQPTFFRKSVFFSSVKPELYAKPTVWQTMHSGSYCRLDGRLALTSVLKAW